MYGAVFCRIADEEEEYMEEDGERLPGFGEWLSTDVIITERREWGPGGEGGGGVDWGVHERNYCKRKKEESQKIKEKV